MNSGRNSLISNMVSNTLPLIQRCFFALLFIMSASQLNAFQKEFITKDKPSISIENINNKLVIGKPEQFGVNSAVLNAGIESIIQQALDSLAFPGCQILIAKDGVVIYEKSFGHHTYEKAQPVLTTDLYDLASVTKTTAATLALMKLYDQGKFDLDKTFGDYFPKIAKRGKADLPMRDVLAHQAGLKAWIPYWSESQRKNGKYRRNTVDTDSSARFPYRISDSGLFLHKNYREKKIYKMIKKSKVSDDKRYVYSGLTFYLIPELVERLSGKAFDQFVADEFFNPLGAETLTFNPRNSFPLSRIVPTEVDDFFRMETLHGRVHDEGAAMMLGVSGNAGLFSNARDLAKVYQMFLNGGIYEQSTYLSPQTIAKFTDCQFCDTGNRRGLGFDKPLIDYSFSASSVAQHASSDSYGHTGYTGNLVWADPATGLLFVFLSNRVHPTRNNSKIYQLNVRPNIHNLIYNLFEEGSYGLGQR
jgi:CubicO group peptidase (beta-lactamase class C family)